MPNRGKRITAAIVVVAVCAAGVAWWYGYRQGQRVLTLWGPAAAYRIRLAPRCELLTLEPASEDAPADLVLGTQRWAIRRRVDLSAARGLVHARQALIADSSYRWDVPPVPPGSARWEYALRFQDEQGETLLVFDLQQTQVLDWNQDRQADIRPIAAGLRTFFAEQLAPWSGPTSADAPGHGAACPSAELPYAIAIPASNPPMWAPLAIPARTPVKPNARTAIIRMTVPSPST
jgi:hypothetical protein